MGIFEQTHVLLPRHLKAKTTWAISCCHSGVCLLHWAFAKVLSVLTETVHFLYWKENTVLGQLAQLVLDHSVNKVSLFEKGQLAWMHK